MARFSRFRARPRTIIKYVKTRTRRYRPRRKNNTKLLIGLGIAAVAGFVYKDKIKTLLQK